MNEPRGSASSAAGQQVTHPANPLPGIPNVESPFFETIFSADNFPADTIRIARAIHERGLAVIDFPDVDFDARSQRIVSALSEPDQWETSADGKARWKDSMAGRRHQDAWKTNADVKALATNSTVLDLLSALYGRRARPFQTLNFPLGSQQHYHSDSIHFSSIPERFMCGVWVALEDVGIDQGPLEYFPGTHKWPIYTHEHIGQLQSGERTSQHVFHTAWEALVRAQGIQHEVFLPRKGQALIWAANLLHGGVPHTDRTRTRWSQVTHYYFDSCAYYTPMLSDPFRGLIRFRHPVDIATGETLGNRPNGFPIADDFIARATSGLGGPSPAEERFDPVAYLVANPDVAAAGADPWRHWLEHGRREGRSLRLRSD